MFDILEGQRATTDKNDPFLNGRFKHWKNGWTKTGQNAIWGSGVQLKIPSGQPLVCVTVGPEGGGPKGDRGGREGAKFCSFVSLSHSHFRFYSLSLTLSLGVSSWSCGGVFEAQGPQMCAFGVLGPREDPPEREERKKENCGGRGKERNLERSEGGPVEGPNQHQQQHTNTTHKHNTQTQHKNGLAKNGLAQIGQTTDHQPPIFGPKMDCHNWIAQSPPRPVGGGRSG